MSKPPLTQRPALKPEPLVQLDHEGTDDAWALQREYMDWRRTQGLEPSPARLNQWEQAMERLGDNNTV